MITVQQNVCARQYFIKDLNVVFKIEGVKAKRTKIIFYKPSPKDGYTIFASRIVNNLEELKAEPRPQMLTDSTVDLVSSFKNFY